MAGCAQEGREIDEWVEVETIGEAELNTREHDGVVKGTCVGVIVGESSCNIGSGGGRDTTAPVGN